MEWETLFSLFFAQRLVHPLRLSSLPTWEKGSGVRADGCRAQRTGVRKNKRTKRGIRSLREGQLRTENMEESDIDDHKRSTRDSGAESIRKYDRLLGSASRCVDGMTIIVRSLVPGDHICTSFFPSVSDTMSLHFQFIRFLSLTSDWEKREIRIWQPIVFI